MITPDQEFPFLALAILTNLPYTIVSESESHISGGKLIYSLSFPHSVSKWEKAKLIGLQRVRDTIRGRARLK